MEAGALLLGVCSASGVLVIGLLLAGIKVQLDAARGLDNTFSGPLLISMLILCVVWGLGSAMLLARSKPDLSTQEP